jgi:capsular exopolysaccharide synthesis family protein
MPYNDPQENSFSFEISLREIYLMIYDRWILGLSLGVLLSGLVLIFFLTEQKLYEATAILLIESQRERIVNIAEVRSTDLAEGFSMEADLKNHEKKMNSRSFMEKVISELTDWQISSVIAPYRKAGDEEEPDIYKIIESAKHIRRDTGSQVFVISFRHPIQKVSTFLANRYAQEYINYVMDQTSTSNSSAIAFLYKRAEELKEQLASSELELQAYREQNNMVSLEEEQSMTSEKVKTLNSRLTETEVDLLEISTILQQIELAQESGRRIEEIPYVAEFNNVTEILGNIEKLRTERKTLSEIFLRKHPKMVLNESRIEGEETKLKNMIELALIDLQKRKEGLESRKSMLGDQIKIAEEEKLQSVKIKIEYNVFQRKIESIRRTYDQIITRLQETQIASQLNNSNIRIIDKALENDEVAWPNYKLVALLSIALFGFGMIFVPLMLGVMDDKVKDLNDAELFLGKELLGMVPKSQKQPSFPLDEEESGVKEAFNGIYKNLKLTASAGENSLLITSTSPSEGKSFIAQQLACAFSKHGDKTILLDCDFRKPVQHSNVGIPNDAGILNWLQNGELFTSSEELIKDSKLGIISKERLPFDLLRAGGSTKNPTEWLEDKKFDHLLSMLKTTYDLVIIDSPPVGLFPDALFLSDYSHFSLFICKHKNNPRKKVRSLLQRLDKTPSKVRGLIYNLVEKRGGHSYDNFDYYGQYSKKAYQKYYN